MGTFVTVTTPEPTGTLDTRYVPVPEVVTEASALCPAGVTVTLAPDTPVPLLVTVPDTVPVCGLVGADDPPPQEMMPSRRPSDEGTRNDMDAGLEGDGSFPIP